MALTTTRPAPSGLRLAWRQLPREARDTLFLVGVIGWTVLPHLSHLPLWCSALAAGVLLWRAVLAWQNKPLPGLAWRVALSLTLVLFLLIAYALGWIQPHGGFISR